MPVENIFFQALIYLAASVVAVPIAKRLGLGSVLGYLIAGLVIGPFGLKLVSNQHDVLHFAEFGVVMMLFLIGLELQPQLLWRLRKSIIGLGGLQVMLSALLLGTAAMLFEMAWKGALAVGLILGLSSTAIILQTLTEKRLMNTLAGQKSFSVLLFQDIAVIPILAVLPFLAFARDQVSTAPIELLGWTLSSWQHALLIVAVVASIGIGGRYVIRPIFHYVAETQLREVFTATALLLVIGIALLMESIGVSAALGTFLAGVVLADSEYRHELESDIQPFKGLLLGLFFIAVGAGMDVRLLIEKPGLLAAMVAGLMVIKFGVLFFLAKVTGMKGKDQWLFAISLCQGGEFAFVLFEFATQNHVLDKDVVALLILAVTLSMVITPGLFMLYDLMASRVKKEDRAADKIEEQGNPVVIAGYGRFGQIAGRLLSANNIPTTVLDLDPQQIEMIRKFGTKVYYGDASRLDLLRTAGVAEAKLFIIAVDEPEKCIEITKTVRHHFPQVTIMARAYNRRQNFELRHLGVTHVFRETFESSLEMGTQALRLLGMRGYQAVRAARLFRDHDQQAILDLFKIKDDEKAFFLKARRQVDDLARVVQEDHKEKAKGYDYAWELPHKATDDRRDDA